MQPYKIVRSRRRTLAIEITREAEVVVRAPMRCPEREIERFAESRREWIEKYSKKQAERRDSHPEPDAAEREALIAAAKNTLPGLVDKYSRLMGLAPTGIAVTGAKTRFGSCSPKNSLCFSWRLMQYPPEAVEYVAVHEIAHVRHKNHGPDFYALIASVLPDWRERREMLKK